MWAVNKNGFRKLKRRIAGGWVMTKEMKKADKSKNGRLILN